MKCRICNQDKGAGDFYASSKTKCKECYKAAVRQNRLEKLVHYRSYDQQRASNPERAAARLAYQQTMEGRLAHARAAQKWTVSNAIRRHAQNKVAAAIKAARLTPEPCFVCGGKAHAHHPDYSRPLSVTWLCPEHHKAAHRIVNDHRVSTGEASTRHF